MIKLKAVIVDDSIFSVTLVKNLLESRGVEVLGSALNMKDAIELTKKLEPDLITMDMTLPDGDGIECSREILKSLKNTKIIAISSMLDNEILKKAKRVGIKSYLQKPIDEDELDMVLQCIFDGEELYSTLIQNYEVVFKESIYNYFKRSLGEGVEFGHIETSASKILESKGISVAIGIIGKHSGRLIMDMSEETSLSIVEKILGGVGLNSDVTGAYLSEAANIVSGNACSMLNSFNKSYGLRVSPPTVFYGKDLSINIGDIESKSFKINTNVGSIFINVGFKRGDDAWI